MKYRVLNLGQATLPPELGASWLEKIRSSMDQVGEIQSWVKANPAKAAAAGLDKDAANLPPSSDIASYPKLAAIVDNLENHRPIDTSELQCVDNLAAAVKAAQGKIDAQGGGFVEFATSPLGIGIGAGILALGVGIVLSS